MIRGLPHFVKPDEDHAVQLRDLEEYIDDDRYKSACRGAVQRARPLVVAAIRALDVAASGDPRLGVDLSEIPAYPRGRGPRSDRQHRLEIVDHRQPARRRAVEITARPSGERRPVSCRSLPATVGAWVPGHRLANACTRGSSSSDPRSTNIVA